MKKTGARIFSRRRTGRFAVLVIAGLSAAPLAAQTDRPLPGPVVPPDFFMAAVEEGTRTLDGTPGPSWWQNRVDYRLEAALEPASGTVQGSVVISYENRSPEPLARLVLHLHQNLHAPGVRRNEAQELTGGVSLDRVRVRGREVGPRTPRDDVDAGYLVEGTLMDLPLGDILEPGETVEVEVGWTSVLPQSGAGRMGWSDREMYFVAYWFPRVAVYDDLRGWDAEPYLGAAEFYDTFGDYEAALTVPAGWTVMATGQLLNPQEVLSPGTRERLAVAASADTVVTVASAEDRARGRVTTAGEAGRLTWRFRARQVRDFTWTASDVQQWDATSARVPDRDGDGVEDRVAIHAFWRPDRAPLWSEQARYAKHAIEYHSRHTGLAYPWSHMTSVEGDDIIGGGMEFPMLTLIGPYRDRSPRDLYNVTSHELAHMWIPMIVGTNEKRYAWIDEGSTTFLENESRYAYWPDGDAHAEERTRWLDAARRGAEEPLMRHGDYYQAGGYGVASYSKPGTLLVLLRDLLGEAVFDRAYRSFIADWAWRHPSPWDFFHAFEREAGVELDWFWEPFYYRTWTVDLAVARVEDTPTASVVHVEARGGAPFPATVLVELDSGRVLERRVSATDWLDGPEPVELHVPAALGRVLRVEVDPSGTTPDVDRENNSWVR